MTALDLHEALRSFEALEGRRAFGGRWALAGFSLQAAQYLADVVRWSIGGADPSKTPQYEALSDILRPSDGAVHLVQVKRTLRRVELRNAVREFDAVLNVVGPDSDLGRRLRFQVVCAHRITKAIPQTLNASKTFEGHDANVRLARIIDRLAVPAIIESANPLDKVHAGLWHAGIKDPHLVITSCYGELLATASDPAARGEALAWRLHSLIENGHREGRPCTSGQVISPDDVTPGEIVGEVVVGEVPRPIHLRRRCFRDRIPLALQMDESYAEWMDELADGASERVKLPVFWVSGRSGCGKSVAMLQLMARLAQNPRHGPVVRFGERNGVAQALRAPPTMGFEVWVVDDIYQPGNREVLDLAFLSALHDAAPPVALVTCGPDEQLAQFRSRLRGLVDVRAASVQDLSSNEVDEFIAWYQERSGVRVLLNPRRLGASPMLVQLMFELAGRESLGTFARRFRDRLTNLDVFDEVRMVLALNSLYMHYPSAWVDDSKVHLVEALMREHHLEYTHDKEGLRLAHAHLAWCLYSEWAASNLPGSPETIGVVWGGHLASLLGRMMDEDAVEVAQEMLLALRVSTHAKPKQGTFQPASGRDVLRVMWTTLKPFQDVRHLPLIHQWSALDAGLEAELQPSPRSVMEAAFENAEQRRSLSASAVHDLYPDAPSARDGWRSLARKWSTETEEVRGKGLVMERLVMDILDTDESSEHALVWFRNHRDHDEAPKLAKRLAANQTNAALRSELFEWIAERPDSVHRWDVLPKLIRAHDADREFLRIVVAWVRGQEEHPHLHLVVPPLLGRVEDPAPLIDMAIRWVEEHPNSHAIVQVLQALVSRAWADQRVRGLVANYTESGGKYVSRIQAQIMRHQIDAGDPVLEVALSRHGIELQIYALRRDDLREKARALLLGSLGDGPLTTKRLEALLGLMSYYPGDRELTERGLAILSDAAEYSQAGRVALALFQHGAPCDEARTGALRWLRDHRTSERAASTFAGILRYSPGLEVFNWAWEWAELHLTSFGSTAAVLASCFRHDPRMARRRAEVLRWRSKERSELWIRLVARPGFQPMISEIEVVED